VSAGGGDVEIGVQTVSLSAKVINGIVLKII